MNDSVNDSRLSSLLELLEKRTSSRDDADLETKFFNDTLEYFLSVQHWWCTLRMLPIARESLWLFSLPDHDPIVQYKTQLNQQLRTCSNCAKYYQLSKVLVRQRYEELFPQQTVHQFFQLLNEFDLLRIQSTLQTSVIRFALTDHVVCALIEIVFSPHLLSFENCDRLFCTMFDQIQKTGLFPTLDTDSASHLFRLSLHHHRVVRFWSRKLLERFISIEEYRPTDLENICVDLLCSLSGKSMTADFPQTDHVGERWKTLRLLASTVSPTLLETSLIVSRVSMPDLIRQQLATPSEWLSEILKTMTIMLIKLQRTFWGEIKEDSDIYDAIIKQICEHHVFQSVMKIAREGNVGKILQRDGSRYPEDKLMAKIKSILEWMYPYWSSLRQSPVEHRMTEKILDTTFGYFQMDTWGVMSRAYCAELGLQMIEQCLSDDSVPMTKIEEYIPRIVSFAHVDATSLPVIVRHMPKVALNILGDLMDKHTSSVLLAYQSLSIEEPVESSASYQAIWNALMFHIAKQPSNRFVLLLLKSYASIATIDLPNISQQKNLLDTPHVAEQIHTIHNHVLQILSQISLDQETKQALSTEEMIKPLLHLWISPYYELRTWVTQIGNLESFLQTPRILEALNTILQEYMLLFDSELDIFRSIPPLTQVLRASVGLVQSEPDQARTFWDLCWKTNAIVIERGLSWAEIYKPREVVDALIPVLDIGQGLLAHKDTDLAYHHVCSSTESLSHWIYVTRQDVISRLMPLLISLLNLLKGQQLKISVEAYDRLMTAATGVNSSKLSAAEKEALFMALSAHEPTNYIFLNDSDDEEVEWQTVDSVSYAASPVQSSPARQATSFSEPPTEAVRAKLPSRQMTLDQSFANVGLLTPPRPTQPKITNFFGSKDEPHEISDDEFADEYGDIDIEQMVQEGLLDTGVEQSEPMEIDPKPIPENKPKPASNSTPVSKPAPYQPVQIKPTSASKQASYQPVQIKPDFSKSTEHKPHSKRADPNPVYSTSKMQPKKAAVPIEPFKRHQERVYVPKSNQQTYSVTSTGRRLKPPPMGFSKIKHLREELKAEQRMMATAKSPSSAVHRRFVAEQSSSDSSEDEEGGLEGLVDMNNRAAVQAESASLKALFDSKPKRTIQMIDNPTQEYLRLKENRVRAQIRKQKITPNIDPLFKAILAWDLTLQTETPPEHPTYTQVPTVFKSFLEYKRAFEPLLFAESWCQIQRAKEGLSQSDVLERCMVAGRCHTNDFVDITFIMPMHMISNNVSMDDLVCVANHFGQAFFTDSTSLTEGNQVNKAWKKRAFLGKVTSINQTKNMGEVCVRCYFTPDRIAVLNSISPKTHWSILRIMSLTTTMREYAALEALEHYELGSEILRPTSTSITLNPSTVQQYCKNYGVNEPQAEAIASAIQKKNGFSLIQGPPGTGKTKTILALIVSLLDQRPNGKLLVSAPSNAAVDEITKRLKEGITTARGIKRPNVVRVGVADSVNASVKDRILDRLIETEMDAKVGSDATISKIGARLDSLHNDIRNIQIGLDDVDREITQAGSDMVQMSLLRTKRKTLGQKLTKAKTALRETYQDQKNYGQEMEVSRVRARQKVFANAEVVCATLSGSGHDMLTAMGATFETVIVDEAAQSIEMSSLIPLKFDTQRCILVGDPNQLPPTVMSTVAAKHDYQQSLFMRLEKSIGKEVNLLSIQYRMHPEISIFPSKLFYQSRLQDGPGMERISSAVWHSLPQFPPYCFYDIRDGQEKMGRGKSIFNVAEADAAVALVDSLVSQLPTIKFASKIGIITPYKQQVGQLKARFQKRFGSAIVDAIDFNTVDGFQGQEKDIIIFSCVRAGSGRGIGFLADMRRMNVGLTRAKYSLFVLGHARSLSKSEYWGDLVRDAEKRSLIRECEYPYFKNGSKDAKIPPNIYEKDLAPLKPTQAKYIKGPVKIQEPLSPRSGSKRPASPVQENSTSRMKTSL